MGDFWSDWYNAIKAQAKEVEKTVSYVGSTVTSGTQAAVKETEKVASNLGSAVSSVGSEIAKNPDTQQAIASSVADTQQASATQAAQAQAVAEQKKAIETTKTNTINASNQAMIKQASAVSRGLSSNILTGAQGVDKSKEKTSAVVLGGSDSPGSRSLGGAPPQQQMQGRVKRFLGR